MSSITQQFWLFVGFLNEVPPIPCPCLGPDCFLWVWKLTSDSKRQSLWVLGINCRSCPSKCEAGAHTTSQTSSVVVFGAGASIIHVSLKDDVL